ncbi:MAG: dimethyl sulfoxide reductase anchor subunit [Ideonella sp.]|nr:dimethyl sulfoxide reductase anchor subunit [Ideonella sp.]MCC7455781.1 dimethyl sulfoxide reductase anchor subunit [Nitrospira sp.]
MSFGPNPWQQTNWDARAAGNFIGGGAGSGLVVATVVFGADGGLRITLLLLALALIGGGLTCVWAEIGRPWRALNVFANPNTSWMTREALVAPVLLGSTALLMLLGIAWIAALAALAALAFLYCQARILRAARGIPAWREPMTLPLIIASGLSEGMALYAAGAALWGRASTAACLALALLLGLRVAAGAVWRQRLAAALRGQALRALAQFKWPALAAGALPLALVLAALLLQPPASWLTALQVLAGVLAAAGGAAFKFVLITRAAFNQGFALPHLPVRGARRRGAGS